MEKEKNGQPSNFHNLHQHDYSNQDPKIGENSNTSHQMVDYMLNQNPTTTQHHQQTSLGFIHSTSLDKLSFGDVMQFSDFGPKLALNQTKLSEEETAIDPVYFLKFPVLNEKSQEDDDEGIMVQQNEVSTSKIIDQEGEKEKENTMVQVPYLGENEGKTNKRKRPRIKTSEEVESQRMTHIAVERNRRKQMNEHLRVLRSLMPGSYVQRGDQASIIGGAIEFVRELEQLLQCLESQKRRRLYGDGPRPPLGDPSTQSNMGAMIQNPNSQPQFFPLPDDNYNIEDGNNIQEETAESKSCLADVEVKLLGFDAMIKILSRRRPGQLIKTIAALEDMQLNILHTNITTIEQTVLYSFNVKISGETSYTADDIANSIQQIFSFIHANSPI